MCWDLMEFGLSKLNSYKVEENSWNLNLNYKVNKKSFLILFLYIDLINFILFSNLINYDIREIICNEFTNFIITGKNDVRSMLKNVVLLKINYPNK